MAYIDKDGSVKNDTPGIGRQTPARCAVADGFGLQWAVYPCGWKWELGDMSRETEPPSAIFRHKDHAEAFLQKMWPQLGEVRPWPNNCGETRRQ